MRVSDVEKPTAPKPCRGYPLRTVAAREFIHDIDERVEASIGVRPRFDELLDAGAQAPVGFFGVPSKRHGHVHQLANRACCSMMKFIRDSTLSGMVGL